MSKRFPLEPEMFPSVSRTLTKEDNVEKTRVYREKIYSSFFRKERRYDKQLERLWEKYFVDPRSFLAKLKFINRLEPDKIKVIVSGGQLSALYFDKEWESDLDIYCTQDAFQSMFKSIRLSRGEGADFELSDRQRTEVTRGIPDFMQNYRLVQGFFIDDVNNRHHIKYGSITPYLKAVLNFEDENGKVVQFIVPKSHFSLLDLVDNFDLDCCKLFYYNGILYSYPTLNPQITSFVHKPTTDEKERQEKYRGRGFTIVESALEIKLNYHEFSKTEYSDCCIEILDHEFYVSLDLLRRTSTFFQELCKNRTRFKQETGVLPIGLPHFKEGTHLDMYHILRYVYGYDNRLIISFYSMWGIFEIADYLGLSKVLDICSEFIKIIPYGVSITKNQLIIAYRYNFKNYELLMQNYARGINSNDPFELVRDLDEEMAKDVFYYLVTKQERSKEKKFIERKRNKNGND